jgi:phosphoglycolate phosphatase-like HAD superfamily hydrolase
MEADSHEDDFHRVVHDLGPARFLPDSGVEIVRALSLRQVPQHALFDFDGTLSLIREGWPAVMVPMMVEILQATGTSESNEELSHVAYQFVMDLTGKQTIYQMIRLAEEVRRRGGTPQDPLAYKQLYHDRLAERIAGRHEALRSGRARAEDMLVPGAFAILSALREREVILYLASGTDEKYVVEEARLLGLDVFFGGRIYGAIDDYKAFSKALVIDRILSENDVLGDALLGFGDGYVEILNIKQAGGVAVAVASDEAGRSGRPDAWKRERLIGVGADLVVPDFRDYRLLLDYLWSCVEGS